VGLPPCRASQPAPAIYSMPPNCHRYKREIPATSLPRITYTRHPGDNFVTVRPHHSCTTPWHTDPPLICYTPQGGFLSTPFPPTITAPYNSFHSNRLTLEPIPCQSHRLELPHIQTPHLEPLYSTSHATAAPHHGTRPHPLICYTPQGRFPIHAISTPNITTQMVCTRMFGYRYIESMAIWFRPAPRWQPWAITQLRV
jgi:hypothetical protein